MRLNTEVSLIAYSGKSVKTSRCESYITGQVIKITTKYIWLRDSRDGSIWKSVKS